MYDAKNTVIYVGKAKDLYNRVSQYFLRPQAGKVQRMVMTVDHFETIITRNEKEAFILEMNLIQTHFPRFNILLKDGSHYPYIAISKEDEPRIVLKRNTKDKKYHYFGPYPSSGAAYQMMDLCHKIFPIRRCDRLPSTPCLYYHLGQCMAPCVNKIDNEENKRILEEVSSFLKGHNSKAKNEIKQKMLDASEKQQYELAGEYKKVIDAIDHINITQVVELKSKLDRDIFAYLTREGYLALSVLIFRTGKLLAKNSFVVESFNSTEEQVVDLICQYYQNHPLPDEIVINQEDVRDNLSNILETNIVSVTKGQLNELVLSALDNSSNALDEYFLSARLDDDKLSLLNELGELLNIDTPFHIELFDNSHLQGSSPVGAMVAFVNGEPSKKLYRKFHIEHSEARDDLLSMKEVIHRHYLRSKEEKRKMPDLLLVDGGPNQIAFANEALKEIDVYIPLYGLEKNDKHQTSALVDTNGKVYPIENKAIFFMLTRMQDEVHRFAITFHKDQRNKKMTKSILDDIPGLGSHRKEMLNKAYKDINELKNASVEELSQIVPYQVAEAIFLKLH